jgi:MarR family transcriptional regulator, temperature-dependent positive regulator of motility
LAGKILKQQSTLKLPAPLPPDEFDLYRLPGHLIRRMHQAGTSLFDANITKAGFDLTPVQFAALRMISNRPGLDQARLASAIAHDRVTTGGVVDRLVQKAFVRRQVNQADRRARELYLTPEGETLLAEVTPIVQQLEDELLMGLSAQESETFLQLLQKNLAAINETSRAPLRMVPSIEGME